ncbi:hypothetical protein H2201_002080 [Coniosporium apollinis]|uniref:Transmembrane protein UsgS n=2 Tax=Coniosporium TaxID=2810619 RepID=A0ABQ9P2X1_9PEZI|nr:hypothetical protein H2199_000911 [Cladosporium sp. JES 115]KAJ9667894.1 hypothetical protein H2201_002080 [Coniosporium apollinis]
MSNFDPNAILRGVQLTFVGAHRALQNPRLFTSDHYKQAAIAVAVGIAIRVLIVVPTTALTLLLEGIALVSRQQSAKWVHEIVEGLDFVEDSVLQVPFFLMSLMRYVTPTLDQLFMDSLQWVDETYFQKHQGEDPEKLRAMYWQNMRMYPTHGATRTQKEHRPQNNAMDGVTAFMIRYARRTGMSLAIYALSHLPYVGRFVLPAASFYTFNKAVGPKPAIVIFGSAFFLPRRYLVVFLQTYFSSRSLMRELLEPYFARIHFNKDQKRRWFRDREGVLFGFAVGFFMLIKIPLLGVLFYGIAEAATAYLITKITEPPPPPPQPEDYADKHVRWKNKHEFLALPFANLDALNIRASSRAQDPLVAQVPDRKDL